MKIFGRWKANKVYTYMYILIFLRIIYSSCFLTCRYQRSSVSVVYWYISCIYICIIYTTLLYIFLCNYQQQQPLCILSLNKANNLILVFLGHRLKSVLNPMTQETTTKMHITVVFLVGTKRKIHFSHISYVKSVMGVKIKKMV